MRLLSCRTVHSVAHKMCMNLKELGWIERIKETCLGGLSATCELGSMIMRVNKSQSSNVILVHIIAALMIRDMMK